MSEGRGNIFILVRMGKENIKKQMNGLVLIFERVKIVTDKVETEIKKEGLGCCRENCVFIIIE